MSGKANRGKRRADARQKAPKLANAGGIQAGIRRGRHESWRHAPRASRSSAWKRQAGRTVAKAVTVKTAAATGFRRPKIIPVAQNQVARFEEDPEGHRPEEHREELSSLVADEGAPAPQEENRIENQQVAVPGRDIPDGVPPRHIADEHPEPAPRSSRPPNPQRGSLTLPGLSPPSRLRGLVGRRRSRTAQQRSGRSGSRRSRRRRRKGAGPRVCFRSRDR